MDDDERLPIDRYLLRGVGIVLVGVLHVGIGLLLFATPFLSTNGDVQHLTQTVASAWLCGLPVLQAVYVAPLCAALWPVRRELAEGVLYGALLTLALPAAFALIVTCMFVVQ